MLFWPIVILGTVVLAVFLASHPDVDLADPSEEHMRALYLAALLILIIFGGIGRMLVRSGRRTMANAVVWLGLSFTLITGYAFRSEASFVWDRLRGELMPSLALSHAPGEVELRRAWDGHYRATALVNGRELRMLVDTGASMVILPLEYAAQVGIDPDRLRYSMPVATANGTTSVAPIRLERIEVGPIVVRDVIAAVAQEGRLETPLLGMSFLERLTETIFRGDKLILRQSGIERGEMLIEAR